MPEFFKKNSSMSLGVELELQLIDKSSFDLKPAAPEIISRIKHATDQIKPEIFRSMIEINTGVCNQLEDVRSDLLTATSELFDICDTLGVALASTGTHPFARYSDRIIFPNDRYRMLIDRNQWLAQRMSIFGIHVHIGMRDGDHAIDMINGMMPYMPYLLAFSASSPFWQGEDTGLASSRVTVFEAIPTAGHPCVFANWQDYQNTIGSMLKSSSITAHKDIWWDIRPSPEFGTIEIRVCDGMPTLTETMTLVALIQALAHKVDGSLKGKNQVPRLDYWIIRENKWRAARWGMDAELVVDNSGKVEGIRDLFAKLIDQLLPISDRLGSRPYLLRAKNMLAGSFAYERQRQIFAREKSTRSIAASLVDEFRIDWETLRAGSQADETAETQARSDSA